MPRTTINLILSIKQHEVDKLAMEAEKKTKQLSVASHFFDIEKGKKVDNSFKVSILFQRILAKKNLSDSLKL